MTDYVISPFPASRLDIGYVALMATWTYALSRSVNGGYVCYKEMMSIGLLFSVPGQPGHVPGWGVTRADEP